jgi:hypothetical protein
MPNCDSCGFSHAQADHCINCGSTDPFRRHRIFKLAVGVSAVAIALVLVAYFYTRYSEIEHSVRQAEMTAEVEEGAAAPQAAQP